MTQELASPEDFATIANLMGSYQHKVDSGDEDGFADLFTDDGAFLGMPEEVAPPDTFRGREGLKLIARISKATAGGTFRHMMGSFTVQYGETRDEAYANYYILASTWDAGPKLEMFTDVTTHLVKLNGAWKIKTNTMKRV